MSRIQTGINASDINFEAKHVLFVEGDTESIDLQILTALLGNKIRIEPLGPSYSLDNVAKSLYTFHPYYYFIIDRDHHTDEYVARCWDNFPNPDTNNLLVWRKRAVENYFLDPAYLRQSQFCVVDEATLQRKIAKSCQERLFLDVANYVIITIREELKQNWIQMFTEPRDFQDAESALKKLLDVPHFKTQSEKTNQKVSSSELERLFKERLCTMTGGTKTLEFGSGTWRDMISGKKILSQVVNSKSFTLPTGISQEMKVAAITKDLVSNSTNQQPDDFQRLRELIEQRLSS